MNSTTGATRTSKRTASLRSRLPRAAAAAISTVSMAVLGLAGTASPASATPATPSVAVAPAAAGAAKSAVQPGDREQFCLFISYQGRTDSDCGADTASVRLRGGISTLSSWGPVGEICVALGSRGRVNRDCEASGRATTRIRGPVSTVGLRVEDAVVCVRALSGRYWTREMCGADGGWVYTSTGRGAITGLRVSIEEDARYVNRPGAR